MDRTHLRFFTRKSAIDMFEQCELGRECVPMAVADRGLKARLLSRLANRAIEFKARQSAFIVRPVRSPPRPDATTVEAPPEMNSTSAQ